MADPHLLPEALAGSPWTSVLTRSEPARPDQTLLAADVLRDLPVALLTSHATS